MSEANCQRSLTLLETLIALVLVVAMGALIFPSLMNAMEERAFESAADETNEQLMRARAHAQATGSPVEVTYDASKSQVQARIFQPMDDVASMIENSTDQAASLSRPSRSSTASEQESGTIGETWALVKLGPGMRIVARPPAQMTKAQDALLPPAESLQPGEYETLDDLGKGQEIRLAVFMPDGTALMGDQVWLNDNKGRIGVFTINPWSGLPFFKRLADWSARNSEGVDEPRKHDRVAR